MVKGVTACKRGLSLLPVLVMFLGTSLSLCADAQNIPGDIRLFGGSGSHEGRVEIFLKKQWGTVCNDTWDINDVTVTCRQLGNRTAAISSLTYRPGEGQGPVWYHDVRCDGSEWRLEDCPHEESTVDACSHVEDAGAQCQPKDDDLRLVGGSTPNEGRVEIYRESELGWGSICSSAMWDKREADVVCRHVGYPLGALQTSGNFGMGNGPAWLGDLECTGSEKKVPECKGSILQRSACLDEGEASVVCNTAVSAPTEELSVGAIAGISVGFGLVIILCCIFSLNCKCQACWKRQGLDDTDVYQCNTTSNADSRNYSSNSHVKSEMLSGNSQSESRQDPVSDIDPNMFLFAPKVPPAGFDTTTNMGVDKEKLLVTEEGKEPNGILVIDPHTDESHCAREVHENNVTVSMMCEEADDSRALSGDERQPENAQGDQLKDESLGEGEGQSCESVIIDPQSRAHFHAGDTAEVRPNVSHHNLDQPCASPSHDDSSAHNGGEIYDDEAIDTRL